MTKTCTHSVVPVALESAYAIVADIEAYPEFVPACKSARILSTTTDKEQEIIDAELGVRFGLLRKSFATRNTNRENTSIRIQLRSGQLQHLEGIWLFQAIDATTTRVSCEVDFHFGANALNRVIEKALEKFIGQLSQAFIDRAISMNNDPKSITNDPKNIENASS